MAREKKLIVVGVLHDVDHPSYGEILTWIRKNVRRGMKIGIESAPYTPIVSPPASGVITPSHVLGEYADSKRFYSAHPTHKFFLDVIDALVKKKAEVVPVGIDPNILIQAQNLDEVLKGQQILDNDRLLETGRLRELFSITQTHHMLKSSLEHDVDVMIVGLAHAAHIEQHCKDWVNVVPAVEDEHWDYQKELRSLVFDKFLNEEDRLKVKGMFKSLKKSKG